MITASWVVTLCGRVEICQRYRGTLCLHPVGAQGTSAENSGSQFVRKCDFLPGYTASHAWRQYDIFQTKEMASWSDGVSVIKEARNVATQIFLFYFVIRNCLLKQVIEGKIKGEMEVARRRKKLLDDLKDRRGYSHLKEEALHRTMWRHRFGGGFGPVVRQNTEWVVNLPAVNCRRKSPRTPWTGGW